MDSNIPMKHFHPNCPYYQSLVWQAAYDHIMDEQNFQKNFNQENEYPMNAHYSCESASADGNNHGDNEEELDGNIISLDNNPADVVSSDNMAADTREACTAEHQFADNEQSMPEHVIANQAAHYMARRVRHHKDKVEQDNAVSSTNTPDGVIKSLRAGMPGSCTIL